MIILDNQFLQINKLRHWMNTAMQLNNSSDEDIILYQNKIKHILLELKEKQRQSRNLEDDEVDQLNDKWNRYNGPHFLPSVRENVRRGDVYPLHKALELRETNEQMEEMLKHLSQLQSLAYEYVDICIFMYIRCNKKKSIIFPFNFMQK